MNQLSGNFALRLSSQKIAHTHISTINLKKNAKKKKFKEKRKQADKHKPWSLNKNKQRNRTLFFFGWLSNDCLVSGSQKEGWTVPQSWLQIEASDAGDCARTKKPNCLEQAWKFQIWNLDWREKGLNPNRSLHCPRSVVGPLKTLPLFYFNRSQKGEEKGNISIDYLITLGCFGFPTRHFE